MSAPVLPDAAEREAALDLQHHVMVMAPAGSGKTGLLVTRMLLALARSEQPEQVVAITFTNKAAAEIRFRLLELLQAAQDDDCGDHMRPAFEAAQRLLAHDRRLGWHLLDQPDRLRALTIDSFNAQLAGRQPLMSKLGGPVRVADDARELYGEAVMRLFADLEAGDLGGPDREALELVLRLTGNRLDRLVEPLSGLLAQREQWLNPVMSRSLDETEAEAIEAELLAAAVRKGLRNFEVGLGAADGQRLVALLREGAARAPGALGWAANLPDWPARASLNDEALLRACASMLITKDGKKLRSSKGIRSPDGFAPNEPHTRAMKALLDDLDGDDALLRVCRELRELPDARYPETLRRYQRALRRCLRLLAAQLLLVFGERGETDFVQIAGSALDALNADDGIGDALLWADRSIRHLLVDEMQDTSESQVELLKRLTKGWEPGDGRSLFLVGDPQQSIYAFRKAEVRLFLELWDEQRLQEELPLTCLRLSANFRSSKTVVDWFNAALSAVFPVEADVERGVVPFAPSVAQRVALQGEVRIAAFGGDEAVQAAEAAAEQAAQLIERHGGTHSVAVLGRARTHLAPVIRALRARGLSPACQDIDPLATQPAVRDLVALARALWHPADRLHWALLLRAPFVGMSWADLVAISAGKTRRSWPQRIADALDDEARTASAMPLSDEGLARLRRLVAVLRASAEVPGLRLQLADRVEAVWHALGGAACVDADALADVQAALRLLRQQASGGGLDDIAAFDRALTQLYSEPRAGQVQVMTVHKSKGLEFDHVLLVGCHAKPKGEDRPLWHLRSWPAERDGQDSSRRHLLVPRPPDAYAELDPSHRLYAWAHRLHTDERRNEALRLLYVAVTRAKRSLTLYACAALDGNSQPRFGAHSFAALLDARFTAAFANRPATAGAAPAATTLMPPPRSPRLPLDWAAPVDTGDAAVYRPQERRTLKPSEAVLNAAEDKRDDRVAAPGDLYAQLVGTLYHEALERIAQDGFAAWADGGVSRRGALSSGFRRLGLPEPQVAEAVDRVLQLVGRTLASAHARWLLGPKPWAQNEYHLAGYQGGQWVAAVIDRCFEDDDGTLWIVDYKTAARPLAPETLPAYLAAGVEQYRAQLQTYVRLLGQLRPGRPLRAGLYFAEADAFVELS